MAVTVAGQVEAGTRNERVRIDRIGQEELTAPSSLRSAAPLSLTFQLSPTLAVSFYTSPHGALSHKSTHLRSRLLRSQSFPTSRL